MSAVVAASRVMQDEAAVERRSALPEPRPEPAFFVEDESARARLAAPTCPVPRCLFVDVSSTDLPSFVAWLRGEARYFSVPVIALVRSISGPAFAAAHAGGADDVVAASDAEGLARRIARLAGFDPARRPEVTQGRALVAHQDLSRRRIIGRILRQAGFEVSFVGDGSEFAGVAPAGEPLALAVVHQGVHEGGPTRCVEALRAAAGSDALPCILMGPAQGARAVAKSAAALGRVAFSPHDAPAHDLLFLANELLRPDVENVRASARVLHRTICAFRQAGQVRPTYGFTYNLSREGLYVQTLDPLARGTAVWIELAPPHADPVVHVRGHVVWSRDLSTGAAAAAPPGFAVRLDEAACPSVDLAAYYRGYYARVQVA